ncbi:MAG: exodeoxyribonuclease VII large subunit, partial [Bacteroidota bacterium]
GEISNFKRHTSGHLYFTLKDEGAQIQAVMWRGRAMSMFFTPQDGMKVVVRGSITVYEVRGIYQIDVVQIQPMGVGELQLAFERLKQRLAAEGLFDPAHKKPTPKFPERIGIVSSPTGAAIHDILTIISRRFPAVEVLLAPVAVQGVGAAEEIAEAIRDFNEYGKVDVLIVGRGGGSLEDLWAFNEEIVARAIYNSKIPVISAVGHEVDFTISDFVADLRAPTPSAAAELVVPDRSEVLENLRNSCYTMQQNIAERISSSREKVLSLLRSYRFNRPVQLQREYSQRVDELQRTLVTGFAHRLALVGSKTNQLDKRLHSLNPDQVLKRGYTIVYRDGRIIESAHRVQPKDEVSIRFRDGDAASTVEKVILK